MTRLTERDILGLKQDLSRYDEELVRKTGRSLQGIACRAAGISGEKFLDAARTSRVAAVSITSGQGVITGFARAVGAILRHLGFRVIVPEGGDVTGIAMAVEKRAHIVFMADDVRFIALDLRACRMADNAESTGRGYVAALEGMAGGLGGREVLVIGAGRVGMGAIRSLEEMGTRAFVFDLNPVRAKELAKNSRIAVEGDLEQALRRHTILIDATPVSGIIEARHIQPKTLIAAPGIPLGLTPEAQSRIGDRLIHDPLQIGVATMMATVVSACSPPGPLRPLPRDPKRAC